MPPPPPGGKPSPEPENKLWLSKNHGIPMKIVRSNLGPNSKDFVSTARKIEVEVNIPDSMFEPPKGMKIVDRTPKPRPKPR
jgi:outer membrane lipoprotein-sorting protein